MTAVEFFGGPWDGQVREVGELHPHIAVPYYEDDLSLAKLFAERLTGDEPAAPPFRVHYYRLERSSAGGHRYVDENDLVRGVAR